MTTSTLLLAAAAAAFLPLVYPVVTTGSSGVGDGLDGLDGSEPMGTTLKTEGTSSAQQASSSSNTCTQVLTAACPEKVRTPAAVLRCDACAGTNQGRLRAAGCSAAQVQSWCSNYSASNAGNMSFMSIMASKLHAPAAQPHT